MKIILFRIGGIIASFILLPGLETYSSSKQAYPTAGNRV